MAMDGNKDEADKCIEIAEKCVREGNRDKAVRFLEKAERLFPTPRAKGKPLNLLYSNRFDVASCKAKILNVLFCIYGHLLPASISMSFYSLCKSFYSDP